MRAWLHSFLKAKEGVSVLIADLTEEQRRGHAPQGSSESADEHGESTKAARAIFIDRDGVLIADGSPLLEASQVRVLPRVPQALAVLRQKGFSLFVVTNQPVVARGLITEAALAQLHQALARLLVEADPCARLDGFYVCPHHPNATLPEYRVACECRKPNPGLMLRAQREHGLDLAKSFMVGDRLSDVVAGQRAGCQTVLVRSPMTGEPPIESANPFDPSLVRPTFEHDSLFEFAEAL